MDRTVNVKHILSESDADELVEDLMDPQRIDIVVVVSVSTKAVAPYLDVDYLAEELEGSAQLAVLASSAIASRVTERLGNEDLSVYGGAGRIYPIGIEWMADKYLSPLIFCFPGQGRWKSDEIISKVRTLSYRPGVTMVRVGLGDASNATATVTGVINESQVWLNVLRHGTAKMLSVHLYPGLAAARLVTPGQVLLGQYRYVPPALFGDFHPDPIDDAPLDRARVQCPDGSVIPALVTSVAAQEATVSIHPSVIAEVVTSDGDLDRLMSVGDVIAVELIWNDGRPVAALADPEEAGLAMSVFPGGPPWLDLEGDVEVVDEDDPDLALSQEIDVASLELDLAEALRMIADLTAQKLADKEQLRLKVNRIGVLQKDLRIAQKFASPRVYSDELQQMRFEIDLNYLTRVPEPERESHPLMENYRFGPGFLNSVQTLVRAGGIKREKIVDVCVEVLCRKAELSPNRTPRPWRVSKIGSQLKREDGYDAWRINLQVDSPSARRMKYWRALDGTVEFDSVGVHDDGI